MQIDKNQILALLPLIAEVALEFITLPSPAIALMLAGNHGQRYYDLCVTWARMQDEIVPDAAAGYDANAGRRFDNLEQRVVFMLSSATEKTLSTDNAHINPTTGDYQPPPVNENDPKYKLDPDQLAYIQKLYGVKF